MLDDMGNPVELIPFTMCDDGPQGPQGPQGPGCLSLIIRARFREVMGIDAVGVTSVDCDIVDSVHGIIEFALPEQVVNNAGVYHAEFGAFNITLTGANPTMTFSNQCYLWINRGLFGDPTFKNVGPPTMDEIRAFVRDNGPEENLLLDDFEFDLTEICQATENSVRYWNEVNPDVGWYFNTITYCARYKWLQSIAGHMLQVAAHRFRRNHLPYQAGGLSIDDQNKFQQYDQAGLMLVQEYKEWVKTKKVAINCFAAMTSSGSSYGASAYQILNTGI
jgi:hypothetical protein